MTEELYVILIRNIPTTELKTKYLARAGVITQEISSPLTSISTFEERESETFVYFTSLWIRRATERKKRTREAETLNEGASFWCAGN